MTEPPTINPVQVLRDAADYLETYGWHQGGFFMFTGIHRPPAACSLGAIQIAVTGEPVDVFADDFNATPVTDSQFWAVLHAAGLVIDHLRREHNTAQLGSLSKVAALARWNDRDGRTAAEVVTVMRAAADRFEDSHDEVIA
jgi:hypothetical protein